MSFRAYRPRLQVGWASFALLQTLNACSVLVVAPDDRVLLARGAFAEAGIVEAAQSSSDLWAPCRETAAARKLASGEELDLDDPSLLPWPLVPESARAHSYCSSSQVQKMLATVLPTQY